MGNDINFSKAEKFSYAYVDDKYAKIAVIASAGSPTLVDPRAWSYAETHSYVEVDPAELGVTVPEGVEKIYAKVLYVAGGGGSSSGGSGGGITVEKDPIFKSVSGSFATKSELSSYITITAANQAISQAVDAIVITDSFKDLSGSYATKDYVNTAVGNISLNEYATQDYVNDAISHITDNDSFASVSGNYVTSSQLAEQVELILNNVSETYAEKSEIEQIRAELSGMNQRLTRLENVCLTGDAAAQTSVNNINDVINSMKARILQLEAMNGLSVDLGDREDDTTSVDMGDREDETNNIIYGDRI